MLRDAQSLGNTGQAWQVELPTANGPHLVPLAFLHAVSNGHCTACRQATSTFWVAAWQDVRQ
jgi:hypothetical protein